MPSILLLALAACAAPGRPAKPALRLELDCRRQSAPKLCGLAAMEMLCDFYRQPVPAKELEGLRMEAEASGGISGASLKAVLEQAGYYVAVFPGTLDHAASGLYHHLDLKRPLLIMTGATARHYMVVVGYDERKSTLTLLDPASGARTVDAEGFKLEWEKANYFTLLAMPGGH